MPPDVVAESAASPRVRLLPLGGRVPRCFRAARAAASTSFSAIHRGSESSSRRMEFFAATTPEIAGARNMAAADGADRGSSLTDDPDALRVVRGSATPRRVACSHLVTGAGLSRSRPWTTSTRTASSPRRCPGLIVAEAVASAHRAFGHRDGLVHTSFSSQRWSRQQSLASLFEFENEGSSPAPATATCIVSVCLTLIGCRAVKFDAAEFLFSRRSRSAISSDEQRRFALSADDFDPAESQHPHLSDLPHQTRRRDD